MGRVIKLGALDQDKLMDAISDAATITVGQSRWTITTVIDGRQEKLPFLFGKLAKFSHEGHVTVVDTSTKSEIDAIAPNLLLASSPFVYLPEYSGLAYMHVWNGVESDVFPRRFKAIIEATYDNFFVGCNVEPVADYRAFSLKLKTLDRITELYAKVHPPNLKAAFSAALAWSVVFMAMAIVTWFADWKHPSSTALISLVVSMLGAAICSLSIYNAQTTVEEAVSRFRDKR